MASSAVSSFSLDDALASGLDFLLNADPFQRLIALFLSCLVGILCAVQLSMLGEARAIPWTKWTAQTR